MRAKSEPIFLYPFRVKEVCGSTETVVLEGDNLLAVEAGFAALAARYPKNTYALLHGARLLETRGPEATG